MQLVTERLLLREFVEADWSAVLAYQGDPRYLRYYPWTERTEADARAFVEMFLGRQREEPRRRSQLAIALKDNGPLIGNCGIRRKPDNDWEAELVTSWTPVIGVQGMPPKPLGHWSTLDSRTWASAASHPGASRLTQPRPGCWNGLASGRRDGYAAMNASRAAGGIRCFSPCCGTSGRSWPNTGNPEVGQRPVESAATRPYSYQPEPKTMSS